MYPQLPGIEELRALVAVAELGSISSAARSQGVQQQTMSQRIAHAEKTLGITVFDRSPYGVRPTEAGRRVLAELPTFLEAASQLRDRLADIRDSGRRHALSVAASHTIAELYLPTWAGFFNVEHPSVQLTVKQANSAHVCELVGTGIVNVGMIESGRVPHGLESIPLGEDELVVAVNPAHPWAGTTVTAAEVRSTPLVVREEGSGSREVIERMLGGIAPPACEFGSLAAQRAAIATLQAPSVIARVAIADQVALGKLVVVEVADATFTRPLHAVFRRHAHLGDEARALIEIARRQLVGERPR